MLTSVSIQVFLLENDTSENSNSFTLGVSSDSEIRTRDGALRDGFSEQNRSWDDSGTIISET